MKKIILTATITLGLTSAAAAETLVLQTLASWDSFTEDGKSTTGNLTIDYDKHDTTDYATPAANGTLTQSGTQRTHVDISSLNLNLKTGSCCFTFDVSNLTLNNTPLFSATSGDYNTETAAFGASANQWAFATNGSFKATDTAVSSPCTGTLTVYFLTKTVNGVATNYVSAFAGDTCIVSERSFTHATTTGVSAANNLTGLTLGGRGSTATSTSGGAKGAAVTFNSFSIAEYKAVPEPAMAALSLLALAGLAVAENDLIFRRGSSSPGSSTPAFRMNTQSLIADRVFCVSYN